jgi:hypothetical protein
MILLTMCALFNDGRSQGADHSISISRTFISTENVRRNGSLLDAQSVQVNVPSTEWTINDLEANFTGMKFGPEVNTIEDQGPDGYYLIYNHNTNPAQQKLGVSVQINLEKPSIIYGVQIYGNKNGTTTTAPVFIQIQGYDTANNRPNGTIFANISINLPVGLPNWYYQNFALPCSLPKGNYSLVLNGLSIPPFAIPNTQPYRWGYASTPLDPNLHVSIYNTGSSIWNPGVIGDVPLHKIISEANVPIYPESINMTMDVDGTKYPILNSTERGKGYLMRKNLNLNPETATLTFPVLNNASDTLSFNATWGIAVERSSNISGTLTIAEDTTNSWSIKPTITRQGYNHSFTLFFPTSWENVSITKNSLDVTSLVVIDYNNGFLTIPNALITNGASWDIEAQSPKIQFNLINPTLEYKAGEQILFSVDSLAPSGKYTFILYDIVGVEIFKLNKTIPSENRRFTYDIPSNTVEGTYHAAIFFWNNLTDAGVHSLNFIITAAIIPPPDFTNIIVLIIIIGSITLAGIGAYIVYRRISRKRDYNLEKILTQCIDISNLNFLIVMDTKSGIDVFSQAYRGKNLDPTLISGFLQAIRNFGMEVTEGGKDSRTVKLEYKDSIILMTDFVSVRLILIMKDNPSINFHFAVEDLAYDIYQMYGKQLDDFKGDVKQFQGMDVLIDKHLKIKFLYPLTVVKKEGIKLSSDEEKIIEKAETIMKDNNMKYFYTLYLLPENACEPKEYSTILDLIEKGVFQPFK